MKEIVCDISPFIYKQKIYLVDTETQETKLIDLCAYADLVNTLIAAAEKEQVFNFHLFGDLKFIHDIGDELSAKSPLNYSIQDIPVYYN